MITSSGRLLRGPPCVLTGPTLIRTQRPLPSRGARADTALTRIRRSRLRGLLAVLLAVTVTLCCAQLFEQHSGDEEHGHHDSVCLMILAAAAIGLTLLAALGSSPSGPVLRLWLLALLPGCPAMPRRTRAVPARAGPSGSFVLRR